MKNSIQSAHRLPLLFTTAVMSGLLCLTPTLAKANFDPFGFEDTVSGTNTTTLTIHNIPYGPNVGIPSGTPVGHPFNYTFVDGNNLESFNINTGGNIADAGDLKDTKYGTTLTPSTSTPNYYLSPEFGWQLQGWRATSNNNIANWNVFNSSYIGNGKNLGEDYPGGVAGQNTQLSEAININQKFSPAAGNLAAAPGLGSHFLDTHGSVGNSSQLALQFMATKDDTFYITLAFGGRDGGSQNEEGYYRLLNSSGNTVFSGDTAQTPFEAWEPQDPNHPALGAVAAPLTTDTGVIQKNWEYYKQTFAVTAGSKYTLQIMLPDELNFDVALGSKYTSVPGVITDFSSVPEPSTSAVGLCLIGLLANLRRRVSLPSRSEVL